MTALMIAKILGGLVIAGVAGVISYTILSHFLVPESTDYTRNTLKRLSEDMGISTQKDFSQVNILKEDVNITSPIGKIVLKLPGMRGTYDLLLKSGNGNSIWSYVLMCLLLCALLTLGLHRYVGLPVLAAFPISAVVSFFLPRNLFLKSAVRGRNDKFISQFPDALDMIVRSVKSGYPLNTALKMLAENTDAPVSTEFRQVVDEIAYGRSLNEALTRMGERVDEPDIHFFIVVLAVQQETGGNLAEVLNNLSGIIRKRKQLKLKIRAMTSEGRATGYILGGLPFAILLILNFTSPTHLQPLFETTQGNILLGIAGGMITTAWLVVRRMINFEI